MQYVHRTIPTKSRKICSVPQCFSYGTTDIYLHKYPIDEKVSLQWKNIVKLEKPITKNMYVCSRHFQKQDYFVQTPLTKKRRLKKGVIPSLNLPSSKDQMVQPKRNRDCPTQRRRLKLTAVPSQNLPKISYEAPTVKKRRQLQHNNDNIPVKTKALVEGEIDPLYVESCSSTIKKTRKRSTRGTIPSRRTKSKSKKSSSNKNEDTENQMDDKDDNIFIGPKAKEFENDNKFEVLYMDSEKEVVCTRKPSESDETDEASERNAKNRLDKIPPSTVTHTRHRTFSVCPEKTCICEIRDLRTKIEIEDDLPKYMCADCIQKLEDISNFIYVAKINDEKLKQTMLINKQMKIDLSDEDEETLNVTEDISNNDSSDIERLSKKLSIELNRENPLGSDVIITKTNDLRKDKSKKPLLKKNEREQNNITNTKDVHKNSSEKQNDYYSDKKNDCVCWKCGEIYVGLRIPKIIEDLPLDRLKFHCLNCSKPNPTVDTTNLTPFKTNVHPKVYPGKASNGEKKIRCMTCSESFPVSEFVTHQLQKHSVKKKYKCHLCFSSFSHPSLLRRHATRHT